MFETPADLPIPDSPGLIFNIATLNNVIPDGPRGIWATNDVLSKGPMIRERTRSGVVYRFFARERWERPSPGSMTSLLDHITSQALPGSEAFGNSVALTLTAGVIKDVEVNSALIEQAIATKEDPPALIELARQIMTDGFDLACEFIDILRQDFGQYWLRLPDTREWFSLSHYSRVREKWCTLKLPEGIAASLTSRRRPESWTVWRPHILLRVIGEDDLEAIAVASPVLPPTFAEEMVATALIELRQDRLRSAILHAVIGYESAAKGGLEDLMERRLKGLESAGIVDAISREVSTATLGRLVLSHAEVPPKDPPLDWVKINDLYNTRNMIVHRGRRKMPPYEDIKNQVIEVRTFVKRLQEALRPADLTMEAKQE